MLRPLAPSGAGWELLKRRELARLLAGQTLTQIGDNLIKVALVWFVYTLTGSALKMTIIGLLQTLPPFVLGPILGVYLDRWPKKTVMVTADLLRGVLVLTIPVLYTLDLLSLNRLYVLVFVVSVVSAVFGPALFSAVALIAPPDKLTAANAVLQSTSTMGLLIGPVLSGMGIALVGAQNVLYLGAPTFIAAALLLMPVHITEAGVTGQAASALRRLRNDMVVGVRFLFVEHRLVRLLMLASALYSLAASAFVFLLPVYSTHILQAGSIELGWLWSAYGAGMFATSMWLGFWRQVPLETRSVVMTASLVLGAVATLALSVIGSLWGALLLVGAAGAAMAVFTPVAWGMLQEHTSAALRGRVFTIFSSGAMLASMVGMLAFGWSADSLGPRASLLGMTAVLATTTLVAIIVKQHDAQYRAMRQEAQRRSASAS